MENDRTVPYGETFDATRVRVRIVNYTGTDQQSIQHFLSERFQWQTFVEEGDYDVLVKVIDDTVFDPMLATPEDKLNILLYSGPPVNTTPGNWTRLHFHKDGKILTDYVINYTSEDVLHIRQIRPDLFQGESRAQLRVQQPRQLWSTEVRPSPPRPLERIDEDSFTRPRPDFWSRIDDEYL